MGMVPSSTVSCTAALMDSAGGRGPQLAYLSRTWPTGLGILAAGLRYWYHCAYDTARGITAAILLPAALNKNHIPYWCIRVAKLWAP